jgi:hypothetical protein
MTDCYLDLYRGLLRSAKRERLAEYPNAQPFVSDGLLLPSAAAKSAFIKEQIFDDDAPKRTNTAIRV